jgi:hypothetical protein
VKYFEELDDIGMMQQSHETNLTLKLFKTGSGPGQIMESNAFDGDSLVRAFVDAEVDLGGGSASNLDGERVLIHLLDDGPGISTRVSVRKNQGRHRARTPQGHQREVIFGRWSTVYSLKFEHPVIHLNAR